MLQDIHTAQWLTKLIVQEKDSGITSLLEDQWRSLEIPLQMELDPCEYPHKI